MKKINFFTLSLLLIAFVAHAEEGNKKLYQLSAALIRCDNKTALPLLEDNSLLEATDYRQSTPLMNAALYGCTEVVETLLKKGANVHHRNAQKSSAMIYAMKSGSFAVVKMLESAGALVVDKSNQATSLMNAAESGNYALVKWLVEEKGAEVDERINSYWAISSAAISGHSAIAEFLVTHGASQESIDLALHWAASYGRLDAVEVLIDGNANLNLQNPETGNTPIMIAASSGWSYESQYSEIVRTLIVAGADITIKNRAGKTAMDLARMRSDNGSQAYLEDALKKIKK